jgi:hypothetical protein
MTRAEFTTALIIIWTLFPVLHPATATVILKPTGPEILEEAVERGILVPSESPKGLGPDDSILRSQAAAMLVRALELAPPQEP